MGVDGQGHAPVYKYTPVCIYAQAYVHTCVKYGHARAHMQTLAVGGDGR